MLTDFAPGTTLRTARVRNGLTLEQSAACLGLSVQELRLLEDEDYDRFPSRIHARTYLRRYAEFLGLDPEPLLRPLRRAAPPVQDPDESTESDGFPAQFRHELRTDPPFLRQPRALRRSRRGRHLAPPPVTYVAFPKPGWIRPVRPGGAGAPPGRWGGVRGRGHSRWGPPVVVALLTAALTFVLYVVFVPTGDAAVPPGQAAGPPTAAVQSERGVTPRPRPEPVADAPRGTTVRVLDGTGDDQMWHQAVRVLRANGYEVLSAHRLPETYYSSAVLTPRGSEEEAAALIAADARFGLVRPARDVDPTADLLVIVGRNWGR